MVHFLDSAVDENGGTSCSGQDFPFDLYDVVAFGDGLDLGSISMYVRNVNVNGKLTVRPRRATQSTEKMIATILKIARKD